MQLPTTTIVVGGGLAGLSAAAHLARNGRPVTVLEGTEHLGGRAWTRRRDGFHLNLGPHALYRAGGGLRTLHELGVHPCGRMPRLHRAGLLLDGEAVPALRHIRRHVVERAAVARMLLGRSDEAAAELAGMTAEQWVTGELTDPLTRDVARSLLRTTTYTGDLTLLDAPAAARQLRAAVHGVLYLHDGWSSLVDALAMVVRNSGGTIMTGMPVAAVEHDDAVRTVRLADGSTHRVDAVVLAVRDGACATTLLDGPGAVRLADAVGAQVPVRMAHLDVALRPLPARRFPNVFGIDDRVFLTVQSDVARIAPPGAAVVHVGRYLRPDDERLDHREALERVLDVAQPSWRDDVVDVRYVPRSMVAGDHARPATGGPAGRPGVDAAGVAGLAVAGDWVGPRAMLADAAILSGRAAAASLLATSVPVAA